MYYANSVKAVEYKGQGREGFWHSYLLPDRVFTGQYWDEFSVAGVLSPQNAKVLFLGLGLGSGIRPFLAANPDASILAVDIDSDVILKAELLYKSLFPQISFRAVCAEASQFIRVCNDRFDAIVVDLYENDRFPTCLFNGEFYDDLSGCLTEQGVLSINVAGIPPHLQPFDGQTPATMVASCALNSFAHVSYLPYRRNVTIYASQTPPISRLFARNRELTPRDMTGLTIAWLRAGSTCSLSSCTRGTIGEWPFTAVDAIVKNRWEAFQASVVERLVCAGNEELVRSTTHLGTLLEAETTGSDLLTLLLDCGGSDAAFVPVYIASRINHCETDFSWYLRYIIERWDLLSRQHRQWAGLFGITQAFAMIANGQDRFVGFLDDFTIRMESMLETAVGYGHVT